ncbi:MAG TPA: hypothetical protein VIC25_11145 [Caulobacteraceae bacterium]|jgi:hypothetical protein
MSAANKLKPTAPVAKSDAEREQRLSAALRDNLRRRKAPAVDRPKDKSK